MKKNEGEGGDWNTKDAKEDERIWNTKAAKEDEKRKEAKHAIIFGNANWSRRHKKTVNE